MLKLFAIVLSVAFVSAGSVADFEDDDFELRKLPNQ